MILGENNNSLIEEDTPMPLSDSATEELWEAFRAAGGAELVCDAVRLVLQELIEAEAADAIGAGRYERSSCRVTERNGHRSRLLSTRAGDVELKIPKLRKGSFMPSLLEPRRRIDKALHAVVMEAYIKGGLHPLGGRPGSRLSSPNPTLRQCETPGTRSRTASPACFPKPARSLDAAKAEVLAFADFPRAHWRKIWSINPLERINKEIKRRARVVDI